MKKNLFFFSVFVCMLLFSSSCKKKETCKQCGWYDKTTNNQIGTLEQKCGDAIGTFESQGEQSYTPSQTSSVKSASVKVPKCQ